MIGASRHSFKLAEWLNPANSNWRSHDTQAQFGHQHRRLLMRNRRAFEKRRIDEPHAAQVSLAQVRTVKTRTFQMRIFQAAAVENRLAKSTPARSASEKSSCCSVALRNDRPRKCAPTSKVSTKLKPSAVQASKLAPVSLQL